MLNTHNNTIHIRKPIHYQYPCSIWWNMRCTTELSVPDVVERMWVIGIQHRQSTLPTGTLYVNTGANLLWPSQCTVEHVSHFCWYIFTHDQLLMASCIVRCAPNCLQPTSLKLNNPGSTRGNASKYPQFHSPSQCTMYHNDPVRLLARKSPTPAGWAAKVRPIVLAAWPYD